MYPHHPTSTLFPYTTLFRSGNRRYSRLETCATTDRRASHISLLSISCHHRRLPKRMTKLYASGSASRFQQFREAFNVKHAAAPGTAASLLQHGPEFCVGRQCRIRRKLRMRTAPGQNSRSFFRRETSLAFADNIHAPFEFVWVNDDADPVAVAHFANRPAGERFRAGMTDARAGGDAGKTRVGHQR